MGSFDDVERFAKEHGACGMLTPSTSNASGSGYQLTLVCSCGARFSRWVPADDPEEPADEPQAIPSLPSPPSKQSLEDAMREALEALDAPARAPAPPPASVPPSPQAPPSTRRPDPGA